MCLCTHGAPVHTCIHTHTHKCVVLKPLLCELFALVLGPVTDKPMWLFLEWSGGIQRSCFGAYASTWLQIQSHLHKLTLFKIDFDGHGTGELNGVSVSWCLIGLLLVQSGSCLSSVDNICRWGGWEGPEKDSAYLCPCVLYIKYWLRFHTVLCCVKVLGSVVACSDQH